MEQGIMLLITIFWKKEKKLHGPQNHYNLFKAGGNRVNAAKNKMTHEEVITKWDGLTATEKMGMGDHMITHESDLNAWNKNFDDLSDGKKEMVIKNIEKYNPSFTMTKDSGLPIFG